MTESADKRPKTGRPPTYKPAFAEQAAKLCRLGATDLELADFFALMPTEDDWLYACLLLIRQDRGGVIAVQKGRRADAAKRRLQSSPAARIRKATSVRMWAALKGRSDGALFSRLGYTAEELAAHLEARFRPGMTWANYGRWHVDHIRPCASFDLTDPTEFKRCWSLDNLQPLWAADNIAKGAKYGAA